MNIFPKVLELWPGHESGTDRRTDGQTYGTDRGNTLCPSAILRIGGGIKIPFHLVLFSAALVELAKSIPVHSDIVFLPHLSASFLFPFTKQDLEM